MRFCLSLFLIAQISFAAEIIQIDASGGDGRDGRNGVDYRWSRGFDGFPGSPGFRGGDGSRGRDGGDATDAARGADGGMITAKLEWIASGVAMLTAEVNGAVIEPRQVSIATGDHIVLSARGGAGGNGGLGGSGEESGRGGKGGDATRWNNRSGDGGSGGTGGNAGKSSDGANGGNGGQVTLKVPAGDQTLIQAVTIDISGGRGGLARIGTPAAGRGGDGGEPGNHCFFGDNGYECGFAGMRGMRGYDGRSSIYNPRSGQRGGDGTYVLSEY